jgi:uncharacterized protein YjiS (DUF1127 family)
MSIVTGAKFDLTITRPRRRRRRWTPLALSLWDRLCSVIEAWRLDRRSRDELAHMTLRELRDIGITPVERDRECNRPFWMF